jgi:cyclophilin family peptidyl-prolyl cis-trans isomerase
LLRSTRLISLILLSLVFCEIGLQVAGSSQTPDNRKILLNPKHPIWSERANDVFKVRFETTKGSFLIEVHRDWAPRGVDRFHNFVRTGFFDDSRFFRVRPGFIAQFGIPGDPKIAAVWREQTIPDDPVRKSNIRGTIAYAMTGPDTRTTQLYISISENSRLDADGFAPIGRVIEGMQIIDQLYSGYGEEAGGGMRGGKQGKIFEGGNTYLDREFPRLDKLLRASVVK